ncbi:MAG: hypothetical protein KatS3mg108_2232 [Isosphaeraceae bacterium]|jgi:hypothetical protein|nr:MAG: hypothetical protein KatS3mg108_2232 [Isosphaeraceae bacterium]
MIPTDDQIRVAAYQRWQRRGHSHGHHEADWLAAQQDLLLALNYRTVARYQADARPIPPTAEPSRRVCRFCEQSPPRTSFGPPGPALPPSLGVPGPLRTDVCLACQESFETSLAAPLERFIAAVRSGLPPSTIPTQAYKGLVSALLTMMPPALLELFPDALEWASQPEADRLDAELARRGVLVHSLDQRQIPWSAILVKTDDAMPMPHVLAFLGLETATIELPMPLCVRDEDLDGETIFEPLVASLDGLTHGTTRPRTQRIPIARDAAPRRGRILSLDLP